jgi:hypothetical protein
LQWGVNDEHSENISTHAWLFRRILSAFSEFFRIRRRRDADQGNAVGAWFVRQEYLSAWGSNSRWQFAVFAAARHMGRAS